MRRILAGPISSMANVSKRSTEAITWCPFYATCWTWQVDGCVIALTPAVQIRATAYGIELKKFELEPECWEGK